MIVRFLFGIMMKNLVSRIAVGGALSRYPIFLCVGVRLCGNSTGEFEVVCEVVSHEQGLQQSCSLVV